MVTPYNRIGEIHEIGLTGAFNKWVVSKSPDTAYIQTYPSESFGIFHNAYYAQGKFGGIGGIEFIGLPSFSGFVLGIRPYAGMQYDGSIITWRLNFSPIILAVGFGEGELGAGGGLSLLTFYQFTFLLHNPHTSNHMCWAGIRNSPAAIGLVGGYEYSFNDFTTLRTEYSYLIPPPFSPLLSHEELESLVGSVHYITFGIFTRIK